MSRLSLFALTLGVAASRVHAASSDGKATLKPLFDVNKRLTKRVTTNLRFEVTDVNGAPVGASRVSFSVRHGMEGDPMPLYGKDVRRGVIDVPFRAGEPGGFWVSASLRAHPEVMLPPVRVSVAGVADGLIELPESADVDVKRNTKTGWKGR
jgi:hypothetical protein